MNEFMQLNDGMIGVPFYRYENGGEVTKISGYDRKAFKIALGI